MKKMLLLCMVGIFLSLVLSGCFLLSPSKPTNVSLTSGYKSISITWVDNASNESSYEIEYSVDGTNFYSLVSLPQNSTSYNHTNLNYNYTYSYKVGAKNQFGITWSDVVSKKPLGPATVSGKVSTYVGQTAFTQSAEFPIVETKNLSEERYKTDEIIVKFKNNLYAQNEIEKISAPFKFSIKEEFHSKDGIFGFTIVKVDCPVEEAVNFFSQLSNVEYAEPDYIASEATVPDDTYYSYQWNMSNLSMPQAWSVESGMNTIYVAVLDSGVDFYHPDLAVSNNCGYDFVDNDPYAFDERGHGTHVAGIIAAKTNNSLGVAGMNWGGLYSTKILAIRVLDKNGDGYYSNIAKGIIYAVEHSAKVINMSLGGKSSSTTLYNAVKYAYLNDILIVASAGNDGTSGLLYPAAYNDYVISVGSVDKNNVWNSYSNYGSNLELVAPGGNASYPILSTYYSTSSDTRTYAYMYGTSMAAPHVSGLIALMMSKGITGNSLIRTILHSTAIDLGSSGKDNYYGYGLINPYEALTYTSSWEPLIVFAVDTSTNNTATETYVQENGDYTIECPPGTYKLYAWQDFDHTNSITPGDFYGYYNYPSSTSPIVVSVSANGNYTRYIFISAYVDTTYKPTITQEIIDFKTGLIEKHYR
ncbi:S8 family serine peptidase [Athalassotoga sp.]|uniref:S8 family serine peptidase n=1 Tax=Athalassotoga sp. TaxID=2022597 RepID=UPI003CFD4EA1